MLGSDVSELNEPTVRHPGLMPISVADMMLIIQKQVGSWQDLQLTGVLFAVGLVKICVACVYRMVELGSLAPCLTY